MGCDANRLETWRLPGYAYLTNTPTDSAARPRRWPPGRKTYNNAINWANDDEPMTGETIAEIAKAKGKAAGVITTVSWSHATPAAFGGAHNVNREITVQIANEMLSARGWTSSWARAIPISTRTAKPKSSPKADDYDYVGGKRLGTAEGRPPSGRLEADPKQGGVREAGRRLGSRSAQSSWAFPKQRRRSRRNAVTAMRSEPGDKSTQREPMKFPSTRTCPRWR